MKESIQAIAHDIARREYYRGLRLLLQGFKKEYIRAKQLHTTLLNRLMNDYTIQ